LVTVLYHFVWFLWTVLVVFFFPKGWQQLRANITCSHRLNFGHFLSFLWLQKSLRIDVNSVICKTQLLQLPPNCKGPSCKVYNIQGRIKLRKILFALYKRALTGPSSSISLHKEAQDVWLGLVNALVKSTLNEHEILTYQKVEIICINCIITSFSNLDVPISACDRTPLPSYSELVRISLYKENWNANNF
jgi:hypothetical protein